MNIVKSFHARNIVSQTNGKPNQPTNQPNMKQTNKENRSDSVQIHFKE